MCDFNVQSRYDFKMISRVFSLCVHVRGHRHSPNLVTIPTEYWRAKIKSKSYRKKSGACRLVAYCRLKQRTSMSTDDKATAPTIERNEISETVKVVQSDMSLLRVAHPHRNKLHL